MLVDSWYDQYLGVVILVRIVDGVPEARASTIKFMIGRGHAASG